MISQRRIKNIVMFAILVMIGNCNLCPKLGGLYLVDSGGRALKEYEVGSSMMVAAGNLTARAMYDFRLTLESDPSVELSFARLSANAQGEIPPFHLWYHSGVVGCSPRLAKITKLPPGLYRTFEEAEKALEGQTLVLKLLPVSEKTANLKRSREFADLEPEKIIKIPVVLSKSPQIYPSDSEGCLLNSRHTGEKDMYVTGRNFQPKQRALVSVVPNQRDWRVGDTINDITGVGGAASPLRVQAGENGRFTVKVWDANLQRRGAYDMLAQPFIEGQELGHVVGLDSIISYGSDTGYLLFLRYPPGGNLMDIAGRQLPGSPYFQFADSFAETGDPVWGAVDPTYVPDPHPGGRYAAYYVVNHRNAPEWGGMTNLVDVSGPGGSPAPEIKPVKAGCINGTDFIIWESPLTPGSYDVVVNFGATPAETQLEYIEDGVYDAPLDFLDGADQIGFVVARDPYEHGSYLVGELSYSDDNVFATLGDPGSTSFDIDLRAVVRYPATAAGVDTPVAAGQHPIFIIEHGNHQHCEVLKDPSAPSYCAKVYPHAECPSRTPNHEGYMELLNVLASHGIIAVSIDAYDLTGCVPGWIKERGDLILKHLELWSHMNDSSTYTSYTDYFAGKFNSHVNMNKISVSGHSRGGEASVAAYMRNTTFNIVAVSSIAPVDFLSYTLPDVPYFVILPAADGDVSNLSGIRIYDRAGLTTVPADATVKSGIHVYGANHNFFNTVWADDGDDSWVPRVDYINANDQQRIGEAYLAAFTRIHLLDPDPMETVYADMLRGQLIFPSTAGFKIYYMHHEKLHNKVDGGSGAGAPAGGLSETVVAGPSVHSTSAIKLLWNTSGVTYTYSIGGGLSNTTPYEVLSFRVTQTNSALNAGAQDFMVELKGGGKTKMVYVGRFDIIPMTYDRKGWFWVDPPGEWQLLDVPDHNVMTTVRIPLHSFIMNNSGVTLNNIDTVKFTFYYPNQGEIYVDDVEFSR